MASVVLVHGAWHGPWCWAPVLAALDERGVAATAVDLPGPDLAADAAAVAGAVAAGAEGGDAVVLAGHSYGGMVVTASGDHPAVERLVFLAALVPDEGDTAAGLLGREEAPDLAAAARPCGDGTATLDPALAPDLLYGDCRPADVERAVSLLRPQPLACFAQPPAAVAWRSRPCTYVVCGADRAVPPALQRRFAARLPDASLVEWPDASHSPFLSRPGEVADLLAGLAAGAP